MKHAVYLAPIGDFGDPQRAVEVARAAEDDGWDGIFLWDHVDPVSTRRLGSADAARAG